MGFYSPISFVTLHTGAFSVARQPCESGDNVVGGFGTLHPNSALDGGGSGSAQWYAYDEGPYFDNGTWGWEIKYVDYSTAGFTYNVRVGATCAIG